MYKGYTKIQGEIDKKETEITFELQVPDLDLQEHQWRLRAIKMDLKMVNNCLRLVEGKRNSYGPSPEKNLQVFTNRRLRCPSKTGNRRLSYPSTMTVERDNKVIIKFDGHPYPSGPTCPSI